MYSQIRTSMLDGICAMPVQVEVDISMGMPVFDMVGYLSPEVREAKERVRTALHNCGILLPAKRDRKSTRLNSSHQPQSRMPSSA